MMLAGIPFVTPEIALTVHKGTIHGPTATVLSSGKGSIIWSSIYPSQNHLDQSWRHDSNDIHIP